jgi:cation diffusion facilitator family transporter
MTKIPDHERVHDDHDPDDHHEDHAHDHDHSHDQMHGHDHNHDHDHDHDKKGTLLGRIAEALHLPGYTHDHGSPAGDAAFFENELAIRTVWLALGALALTTVLQVIIYVASGSVALLGDTVHNLGDALNSIPLLIAFRLARRAPNKRYTYGYRRAEDVAGLLIVASIAFSAAYILWESVNKLITPQPLTNLGWVAAAAIIGFLGNEFVALLQIRVGRKIGSEAMIADGLHARTDGLTSLAVLVAASGAALGLPILDPIIGILIGIVIVFITRNAALAVWYRLMDAVDPALVEKAEAKIREHAEVKAIHRLQMRYLGHRLFVEAVIAVDAEAKVADTEQVTDHLSHELYHALPNMAEVTIGVVPWHPAGIEFGKEAAHHRA